MTFNQKKVKISALLGPDELLCNTRDLKYMCSLYIVLWTIFCEECLIVSKRYKRFFMKKEPMELTSLFWTLLNLQKISTAFSRTTDRELQSITNEKISHIYSFAMATPGIGTTDKFLFPQWSFFSAIVYFSNK